MCLQHQWRNEIATVKKLLLKVRPAQGQAEELFEFLKTFKIFIPDLVACILFSSSFWINPYLFFLLLFSSSLPPSVPRLYILSFPWHAKNLLMNTTCLKVSCKISFCVSVLYEIQASKYLELARDSLSFQLCAYDICSIHQKYTQRITLKIVSALGALLTGLDVSRQIISEGQI